MLTRSWSFRGIGIGIGEETPILVLQLPGILHRIEEYVSSRGVSPGDSPDPQRTFVPSDANLET